MIDFSKNDLSKAQKGDQLWDYYLQKWKVILGFNTKSDFPIIFENGETCNFNGKVWNNTYFPRYFWNEIHFDIPERPKRKVKKKIERWGNFYLPSMVFDGTLYEDDKTAANRRFEDGENVIRVKLSGEYEIEE